MSVPWQLACTITARSPHVALLGEVSQREGLLTVIALAGLHLAAGHAHRHAADVRDTLRVVLVAGVAAAIYAQLQLAGLDPVHWSGVRTYVVNGAIALRPYEKHAIDAATCTRCDVCRLRCPEDAIRIV